MQTLEEPDQYKGLKLHRTTRSEWALQFCGCLSFLHTDFSLSEFNRRKFQVTVTDRSDSGWVDTSVPLTSSPRSKCQSLFLWHVAPIEKEKQGIRKLIYMCKLMTQIRNHKCIVFFIYGCNEEQKTNSHFMLLLLNLPFITQSNISLWSSSLQYPNKKTSWPPNNLRVECSVFYQVTTCLFHAVEFTVLNKHRVLNTHNDRVPTFLCSSCKVSVMALCVYSWIVYQL